MYYLLCLRIVRRRTLKFNPRIASTLRPHGKWGDFLTAFIPVTWCLNILYNSSFILKLIEWQSEFSLLTLRVRGKQWYWVYKFDLRSLTDVFVTPRNIGRNKWQFKSSGDVEMSEDYTQILRYRTQDRWIRKYWTDLLEKSSKIKSSHNLVSQEVFKLNFLSMSNQINATNDSLYNQSSIYLSEGFDLNNLFFNKKNQFKNTSKIFNDIVLSDLKLFKSKLKPYNNSSRLNKVFKNINFFISYKFKENKFINYSDFIEETRFLKRSIGNNQPFRCIKLPILQESNTNDSIDLFRFRFNVDDSKLKHKPETMTAHLNIKQKRYNARSRINPQTVTEHGKKIYSGNPFLKDKVIIEENFSNPTKQYKMFKKSKNRPENFKLSTWNRLLRTKRILVLPAHVNITAITNSYDVIHSWHIPGLGLKMDCLPGRATHHTMYIDNVGLYFGQCAEICGRYHHHMPIRVCALPFEHFLVWWYSFGLPRLLFMREDFINKPYTWKKFSW